MEPVTNCSSRALLSSSKVSTACQNHRTTLLSAPQCFSRVLDFQSSRSILSRPPMISYEGVKAGHLPDVQTDGCPAPRTRRALQTTSRQTGHAFRQVDRQVHSGPEAHTLCLHLRAGCHPEDTGVATHVTFP